jgi:hypothetical protein
MKAALQASAFFCAKAGDGPTAAELTSNAKATTFEIRDLKIARSWIARAKLQFILRFSIANSVRS